MQMVEEAGQHARFAAGWGTEEVDVGAVAGGCTQVLDGELGHLEVVPEDGFLQGVVACGKDATAVQVIESQLHVGTQEAPDGTFVGTHLIGGRHLAKQNLHHVSLVFHHVVAHVGKQVFIEALLHVNQLLDAHLGLKGMFCPFFAIVA